MKVMSRLFPLVCSMIQRKATSFAIPAPTVSAPVRKIPQIASLCLIGICIAQIQGSGSERIIMSVKTSEYAWARINALVLMQAPSMAP